MSFVVCVSPRPGSCSASSLPNRRQRVVSCLGGSSVDFPLNHQEKIVKTSKEIVQEIVLKQAALVKNRRNATGGTNISWDLNEAYDRCMELAAMDACSVYFGTSSNHLLNFCVSSLVKTAGQMMTVRERDQIKAFAALAVWLRRTDELVDGINSCYATPEVLDKWEQRLIDLYEGRPHDMYDAALSDALSKFPINLQPGAKVWRRDQEIYPGMGLEVNIFTKLFKEGIQAMRMDMSKKRYETFDELYLYLYHVIGTLSIMFVQLCGTSPESRVPLEKVYNGMVSLGISAQLTDILMDVVEDAAIGRIYLPQDELARAGLSEDDIFGEQFVSNEWQNFMKGQIERVKAYADEGEKFINELNPLPRWILWTLSRMDRQILDTIEENNYNIKNPTSLDGSKILPGILTKLVADQLMRCFPFP